ncbi:lipopolysaccharide biosynthesis protein [Aestuariivirga litoralis]|uniref:lipopolysaccharide biosynthesis protein n=1 Tax=Aestuariivirga litoralis TaxID=2650924 RepID=UPI0018C638C5|nr:oligosaccharide flippase family protein [Aestuariivirga litoralis]MBG1231787.1 oligosaccharide flippase family protein [Aestuariivirga litoralis]
MNAALTNTKVGRSALISFAIKVAGAGLAYGGNIAFAHLLTAKGYGHYALGLNAAIVIAALGGCGFSVSIMRYWPSYLVRGDKAHAKGVVELGYLMALIGGAVMIGACLALWFFLDAIGIEKHFCLFIGIGLLGMMINLGDYSTSLLRAQGSTVASMLPRDVVWRIIAPALVFMVLYLKGHVGGGTALEISALVLVTLNGWQAYRTFKNIDLLGPVVAARSNLGNIWSSLFPIWLASVVFAMIQQFDVVLVGLMMNTEDAGSYFAAQKTAQILSLVLIAGGLVAAPLMSALYHSGQRAELQKLNRKLALAIFAATAFGYLVLVLGGKILLGFFDASFVSAYPVLLVVGFGTLVNAIAGPTDYMMQMTNFEKPYVKVLIGSYALTLIAQILLVPHYGQMGAAVASAGGIVLWNVITIGILRRRAGLDPSLLGVIWPPKAPVDAALVVTPARRKPRRKLIRATAHAKA